MKDPRREAAVYYALSLRGKGYTRGEVATLIETMYPGVALNLAELLQPPPEAPTQETLFATAGADGFDPQR